MQVEVKQMTPQLHSAGDMVEFELKHVDNSFANGLRRVLLSEVPTLAIDSVTIHANSSVLPDEMIAHRLGLTPMYSMKAREMHYVRDCPTKGCPGCEIKGRLSMRCPDNQHAVKVYASNMIVDDASVYPMCAEKFGPWLLSLGRSQEFSCDFVIRKGIGKMHAKFMPVATVAMHFSSDIRLNKAGFQPFSEEQCKMWVQRCPRDVFAFDATKKEVLLANPKACIYCKECLSPEPPFDKLQEPLVVVRRKQYDGGFYDFTFVVESTGVIPVVQLLFDGIHALQAKLEKIKQCLVNDDAHRGDAVPTRRIGGAPTAVTVVNEDVVDREDREDDLGFTMA